MEYSEIYKSIVNVSDVYSFATGLFLLFTPQSVSTLKREYSEFCSSKTQELHQIRGITDLLSCLSLADFPSWKKEWLNFLEKNQNIGKFICFQTLKNLDSLLPEINKKRIDTCIDTMLKCGPLNESSEQEAFFYLSAPDGFLYNYFSKNKIRPGRQIIVHDATGLNSFFKNFNIVRKTSSNGYTPVVQLYKSGQFCQKEITVGFSSIDSNPWITKEFHAEDDMLAIKYDINKFREHNARIVNLINLFDQKEVDIVTFPELALNQYTLQTVKRFLLENELKSVKYIFLGSCWDGHTNEAYVLSKDGSILMRYQKKKPYQEFNKGKNCYVTEDITPNEFVQFLDISGLGRISYSICYDYINDDVQSVCSSVMGADLMFVAAYSNDTDLMKKTADMNAQTKGVVTVLTNACAVADDENLICYLVKPLAENRHLKAVPVLAFQKGDRCVECESCVKIGKISTENLQ